MLRSPGAASRWERASDPGQGAAGNSQLRADLARREADDEDRSWPANAGATTILDPGTEDDLDQEIAAFLIDRRARGLSPRTLDFYRDKLRLLRRFLTAVGVDDVRAITPDVLRRYLLYLGRSHNPGGVHAAYRALRAFLRWFVLEEEPGGWKNPLRKVRPPRVSIEPLEPVPVEHIRTMVRTCRRRTFFGDRDRALLLCLLDTGCRAGEFTAINIDDIDVGAGQVLVRAGKGGKPRMVFLGSKSRRALVAYLRHLGTRDGSAPLWVTNQAKRLSYSGLRDIVRRRAKRAGVRAPTLHSFRRTFALACLRGKMDVYSLQRLMGHADLSMLRRYLAQTVEDVRKAHQRSGPVDNLL